jgi:hypothetical protein
MRLAKIGPDSADKISVKKQVVIWKPVRCVRRNGENYLSDAFPQLLESAYNGELIFKIASMPLKTAITFETAVNLTRREFNRALDAGHYGQNPGQAHWYYKNFVQWISDLGYSIYLTGDEFETALVTSVLA